MNITVYGAASTEIDKDMILETELLGEKMASRGHTLVFGGGKSGMMGAAARGVKKGGGKIIGIAPTFFNKYNVFFEDCTEFIPTQTMRERKKLLEDMADAFIITPGGIGTYDELFEILTLRSLGRHSKPIAVLNSKGYFDCLEALLQNAVDGKFMTEGAKALCQFFDDADELLDYIEGYEPEEFDAMKAKKLHSEDE